MKTKLLIICLLLFTSQVIADDYLQEEYIEDKWTVSVVISESNPTSVIASVNGKITYGDRFRVRIPIKDLESCNVGNSLTRFYTTVKNEKVSKISNMTIPAVFKDQNIYVNALFSSKFLLGHSVMIDMGWNYLDGIESFFQNTTEVSLKLLSDDNIKTDEYFDIPENKFSLNGLEDALERAKKECSRIVKNINKHLLQSEPTENNVIRLPA
jgi:hypothetical protein